MFIKNTLKIVSILMAILLLHKPIYSQPQLLLAESSFFILGSLTMNYGFINAAQNKQNLALSSDLGMGFFVVDNFALGFSVPAQWHFVPAKFGDLGLSLFGTYYFSTDSNFFPYLGLSATPCFDFNTREFKLSSGLSTGILVGLSESVALDIGVAPKVEFPLNPQQAWRFGLPMGFLGVRAFF